MASTNTMKTVLLLTALTMILLFCGRLIGGTQGMIFAFILALAMNFASYWFSDKIALAMAGGAREVSESEAPELHAIVTNLASYARIPKPRIYILDSASPNAFATGRNPEHAAVAVTQGILQILNRTELEAVLSHELGHIRNRDTLTMTVTATIAGAITMLAHMAQWALIFGGFGGRDDDRGGLGDVVVGLLMIILAPIAATIIQLAISRAREFEADATGARISGEPLALADALEKLERGVQARPMQQVAPAAAHLFIVNPLSGNGWTNLFRTHPTTEERVARLRAMALAPR